MLFRSFYVILRVYLFLFVIMDNSVQFCVFYCFQAEENLGMVMIFTLVTAVQEKLNEIVDQIKIRQEEEQKRQERETEEAEKVRTKWKM